MPVSQQRTSAHACHSCARSDYSQVGTSPQRTVRTRVRNTSCSKCAEQTYFLYCKYVRRSIADHGCGPDVRPAFLISTTCIDYDFGYDYECDSRRTRDPSNPVPRRHHPCPEPPSLAFGTRLQATRLQDSAFHPSPAELSQYLRPSPQHLLALRHRLATPLQLGCREEGRRRRSRHGHDAVEALLQSPAVSCF